MSCPSVVNNNTAKKKCGEIIITMKNNAKNVYSFHCWFCDTICIQMKKFTLHLEKEHVTQLKHTTSITNSEHSIADIISVGEIKIEDFGSDDIKTETGDECGQQVSKCNKDELSPKSQDPLETFEDNIEQVSLKAPAENETLIDSKTDKSDSPSEPETPSNDVEMYSFSDDEHQDNLDVSVYENSSDSEFKFEDNKKSIKTAKLKTNVQEKELIIALIGEYFKNPQLWNKSLTERCNLRQKDEILQKITNDLNEKLKLKLKLYMVKKKLNFICKQYEKEIERQNADPQEKNSTENSKLWYYENMSFLKTTVESKLQVKRKKPSNKVKPLHDDQLATLIDIYKNFNSLWDVNHLAYTVKDKRLETLQSMLDEIKQKIDISLDIHKLEKHLNFIHKTFAKDKLTRLECQAKEKDFQPSCSYFDKCEFLETNQGPFRCADCKGIIETYNDFQVHKSQHDGSMPFKCQECGMGFKKITNYTIHAKRHLRVFKFHCEICGKGYPFNAELDLHMRSHTGAQPYLCSVCGEGFRTAISYDNHIRRHEERFKYFCHICKKGFNHMTRLNDHVKAHLNVRDVICTVCGKGFTSRKYLNHHKRIHEGKNYSCNICGKSFAQDAGLRAHKKYHGTPIGVSSIQKEQNKYKSS